MKLKKMQKAKSNYKTHCNALEENRLTNVDVKVKTIGLQCF